ncbi:glycoside hydrolase family 172 protein [Peribacillus sp. V2I11]|uniref:glycoside hydrolase family 172 protein n=1 Tax=Peribacillus sp. V2I11 TaxID=3042277 RepID=UPI00278AC18D|nr:glycoside hydrolase family 172 protein [Peribacillus sp. V2I11]MDQ0884894.1 hypothetical protein [Peribacillus sp. V2I11]
MKNRTASIIILILLALLTAPSLTLGKQQPYRSPSNKGPIGWDIYRQLNRLPELKSGVQTLQFSSYDRTGGNDDGFQGTYSCLKQDASGCVIADYKGSGEIESIWFTRDDGDVTKTGNIQIILDGKKVVDAPLQDVVDGKLGAPFIYPLVANADQSSGGVYIKIPMPFKESMRVITKKNPLFYHVTYRAFSNSDGVKTFDSSDKALDVIDMLKHSGIQNPIPKQPKAKKKFKDFHLSPGEKVTLTDLNGPGRISEFRLRIPQIVGPKIGKRVTDDGRAFGKGGYSEYKAKINPNNDGIRLTRRYDPGIGQQKASILVDGVVAGEWSGLPQSATWADQSVEIPASFTKGKSEITIRNVFVSSNLDFNEFTYWVDSKLNNEWVRTDTMNIGPNSVSDETAHNYKIVGQTWSGVRNNNYPNTGDVAVIAASDDVLQNTRVRMYFDGELTVDSPLGEFFGSALGEYDVRSLFFAMDTAPDGWYSSWWPMPYGLSAKIELYNGSTHDIKSGQSQVTFEKSGQWEKGQWEKEPGLNKIYGYFKTTSVRGETTPGVDWQFLKAIGKGTIVGVTHTMEGKDLTRHYLEGDERVFVNEATVPQIPGTGTEDFYEGGWYFNRGTFTNPINGNPAHENTSFGSKYDSTGAYRLFIGDEISFNTSVRFGIEHGPTNDIPATYGSTTYWYGNN